MPVPPRKPPPKPAAVELPEDDRAGADFVIEHLHQQSPAEPKPQPPAAPRAPPPRPARPPAPAVRPADAALEEVRREDLHTGHTELSQDPDPRSRLEAPAAPAPPAVPSQRRSGASPEAEFEFGEDLEHAAPAPLPEPDPPGAAPAMQGQLEVTDFLAGFDAGAGFATTREAPYAGLALELRELLNPIEELLHDRTGNESGISVHTTSIDDICAQFGATLVSLASRHHLIPLMVRSAALLCEGRPVLREAKKTGSGLYRLAAAGVQTLTVVEGIDRAQAELLGRVLAQPSTGGPTSLGEDGDVSKWFWELGLTHVRLSVLETFEEAEPLPETGLPALEVPDQAVEQMVRLRSRLLSAVPGGSGGRARASAVRNLAIALDDLRALDRDLFRLGAQLLSAAPASRSVLPFPGLPALDAELRAALEADSSGLWPRQLQALLQTAVLLQDPERTGAILDRIVARPQALFAAGKVDEGVRFLSGLKDWAAREPGQVEKNEVAEAIFSRACGPKVLLPLLERYGTLPQSVMQQVLALLRLLPAPVTATLGIRVARTPPVPSLSEHFSSRLEEDLAVLKKTLEQLDGEQAAGLLDGAVAVGAPAAASLALQLSLSEEPVLRLAAARACAALPAAEARKLVELLLADEDELIRRAAVKAVGEHAQPAQLAPALLKAVGTVRYYEWLFEEKRAAMRTAALVLREAAKGPLRQIAQRDNPYKRKSLSETRVAALLALALLKDPSDAKLAVSLSKVAERAVVADACKALIKLVQEPAAELASVVERLEGHFRRYDTEAAEGEGDEAETAVQELSPRGIRAMRIDELEAAPGEKLQVLGAALGKELGAAVLMAREKTLSGEPFLIAVGRITNLAAALSRILDGPLAFQTFSDQCFINGQRLRLTFAAYQAMAPLREVFERLRINEVMFAEAPTRGDIVEMLYAIVSGLKGEREPWLSLVRVFARVRLRELSLIKESWGRQSEVSVDVSANAARLVGMVYLWVDDVARSPDDADLLAVRLERLIRELTDAQEEGDALLEGLLGVKANAGDAALFITHCALLASVVARWLGCRRDQIASLTRCALTRQVGLLSCPRPLLEDLGAESTNEAAEFLRLPLYSATRVAAAECAGQTLTLPFVTAFEALAPLATAGARARPGAGASRLMHSKILEVIERYVFLTSSFPRRAALNPDQALARLLRDPELDVRLVKALANRAAIIPSGTRVKLSDGREAVVLSSPLRMSKADPLVLRITAHGDGEPAGDLLRGPPILAVTGSEDSVPEISGMLEDSADAPRVASLGTLVM